MTNSTKIKSLLLFLFTILILIQFIKVFNKNRLNKLNNSEINKKSIQLKNCIDIENKTDRKMYENIRLSEYCIKEFGSIKK